ncbi:hypothetical protein [Halopiger aswanensis]|uniref:Uncharacterized protein n=1 Tax=Halopiger aswanensis TaxID=148449 RepID=A0A3R7KLU8_9EURY|nr:hypothetical protein [Halopiger aswanensis]RKD95863.1 hypothetical protein ATJ93_2726 [Halopiger aswanensis]
MSLPGRRSLRLERGRDRRGSRRRVASEVKSPAEKLWDEATTIDRTVDRIRADAEAVALATDGATGRSQDVADGLDVDLG